MISAKEAKALTLSKEAILPLSKEVLAPLFKLCEDKVIRAAKVGFDDTWVRFDCKLTESHKAEISKELRMLGYKIQWDSCDLEISWCCA